MKSAYRAVFRPAQKLESRAIAELYRISSDGVADYIWAQLAEAGEDVLDVGERRYARENTDFSYQNVTVAVIDDKVVGMLAAYAMGRRHRLVPNLISISIRCCDRSQYWSSQTASMFPELRYFPNSAIAESAGA